MLFRSSSSLGERSEMYAPFRSSVVACELNLGRRKSSRERLKGAQMIDPKARNARAPSGRRSIQGNFVRRKQRQKMLAAEKTVFAFALHRQRIKADQDIVDQPRMTHEYAAVG